jgi:CHAD domain-containing protein
MDRAERRTDGEVDKLHDVRKAAKRVRYTAEIAVPVLGPAAKRLRKRTKEVQTTLGVLADTVPSREWALRLGTAAHAAGETAWSYGRLHALEEARDARVEAEFRALEPKLRKALRKAT